MSQDSFQSRDTLRVGDSSYEIFRLDRVAGDGVHVDNLPFSLKVLLEALLRREDGVMVRKEDILALASWDPHAEPSKEIQFTPARVIMQDFTGVPCVVDLTRAGDRKSTRLNSSHVATSYAVFCMIKESIHYH